MPADDNMKNLPALYRPAVEARVYSVVTHIVTNIGTVSTKDKDGNEINSFAVLTCEDGHKQKMTAGDVNPYEAEEAIATTVENILTGKFDLKSRIFLDPIVALEVCHTLNEDTISARSMLMKYISSEAAAVKMADQENEQLKRQLGAA
jgi:hypothetical protein